MEVDVLITVEHPLPSQFGGTVAFQMTETKRLEVDTSLHLSYLSKSNLQFKSAYLESPTSSEKSEKLSPESLHAKPWPERPQQLQNDKRGHRWWDATVDITMILIPIPFFILAAAVLAVDGEDVRDNQFEMLDRSIKGATTLFPIAFSAVVGRAAVKYATWKLERGTTLGVLEQLMGSRTVTTAVITQLQIRAFNLISLILIIIWALSPLGSQSVLHILTTPIKSTPALQNISYFNSRQQSYSSPAGVFKTQWFSGFSVLLGSAILEPLSVKLGTMDAWGNAKIPFYDDLPASTTHSIDGWREVSGTTTYSSVFGIPISGIVNGNTTFSLESTYLSLTCTSMSTSPIPTNSSGVIVKTNLISTSGPYLAAQNATITAPWAIGYQGLDIASYMLTDPNTISYIYPKSCPDCLPHRYQNATFQSGSLAFQEFDGFDNVTTVFCTPSQIYVESEIFCIKTALSQQCSVTRQRPSLLPHQPAELTYLSFPRVVLGLTSLLPLAATPQFSSTNLLQNYLYEPLSSPGLIAGTSSISNNHGETPLQHIPLSEMATRLGQILNAYLYSSAWNSTPYLTGASLTDIPRTTTLVGGRNPASFTPSPDASALAALIQETHPSVLTVPGIVTATAPIYRAVYAWLSVFIVADLVMLGAAVVGVCFARKTLVPEYLGFVSSLAKESPWIGMPDVSVRMDGMDRARLLRNVKVRLGDVSGRDEDEEGGGDRVGRLAFARLEETSVVEKERRYV